jgi:tetratricopeptide (TPR) repeat protein
MKIIGINQADEEGVAAAVNILVVQGKDDSAAGLIDSALRKKPESISLLMTKKEFYHSKGDHKAVIDACIRILKIQPDNSIIRNDLADAYAAAGDVNAANRLYEEMGIGKDTEVRRDQEYHKTQKQKTPDMIKRYAERVLRRAYISKLPLSDPDLASTLGLDDATNKAIMSYLLDITEYGDIVPGTLEFERMEKLSLNAVVKGNCTGIEKDPLISIPCAYVAGGARDADEAKLLVAYIYKALNSESGKTLMPDLKNIAESTKKGTAVEDIMKESKIGVYQAKMVKSIL